MRRSSEIEKVVSEGKTTGALAMWEPRGEVKEKARDEEANAEEEGEGDEGANARGRTRREERKAVAIPGWRCGARPKDEIKGRRGRASRDE